MAPRRRRRLILWLSRRDELIMADSLKPLDETRFNYDMAVLACDAEPGSIMATCYPGGPKVDPEMARLIRQAGDKARIWGEMNNKGRVQYKRVIADANGGTRNAIISKKAARSALEETVRLMQIFESPAVLAYREMYGGGL